MPSTLILMDSYAPPEDKPKGYRRSYAVQDEGSGQVLARCDLYGQAAGTEVVIQGNEAQTWRMRPNRKVMPTLWTLYDHQGQPCFEIARQPAHKALNPLERNLFTLRVQPSGRTLVLRHQTESRLDLVFGAGSLDWGLLENGKTVAGLGRSKQGGSPDGWLGKLKGLMRPAYWTLISDASEPVLSAPAFLAVMLLFEAFVKTSEAGAW